MQGGLHGFCPGHLMGVHQGIKPACRGRCSPQEVKGRWGSPRGSVLVLGPDALTAWFSSLVLPLPPEGAAS